MVKNTDTLRKALQVLLKHKKEAADFSRNLFEFMNIKKGELTLENLQKILLLDNQSRGRALMSTKE